jgi:hypothetical protein
MFNITYTREMCTKVERRKIEQMNQISYNIYAWKCHKETPCVAILNKQKFIFLNKINNRKAKHALSGGSGTAGSGRI